MKNPLRIIRKDKRKKMMIVHTFSHEGHKIRESSCVCEGHSGRIHSKIKCKYRKPKHHGTTALVLYKEQQ